MIHWTRIIACTALLAAVHAGAHGAAAGDGAAKSAAAAPAPAQAAPQKSERAQAEENRRKPLQRCDQLAEKAQVDCLQKARERIVEARRKREAAPASASETAAAKGKTPASAGKK